MKILLDTQILLWAAIGKLPPQAERYVADMKNSLFFSSAAIWEVVFKRGSSRSYFYVDPAALYSGLLGAGYMELPVLGKHTLLVQTLPAFHKDPFDRLMLAQAASEGMTFLTADKQLNQYPCSIITIGEANV
jgi:PIN domain nuclease of toxin-antitoxin system